jgi:hypothetical protein
MFDFSLERIMELIFFKTLLVKSEFGGFLNLRRFILLINKNLWGGTRPRPPQRRMIRQKDAHCLPLLTMSMLPHMCSVASSPLF